VLSRYPGRVVVGRHGREWWAANGHWCYPVGVVAKVLEWWNVPTRKVGVYLIEGSRVRVPRLDERKWNESLVPKKPAFQGVLDIARPVPLIPETRGGLVVIRPEAYGRGMIPRVRLRDEQDDTYRWVIDFDLARLAIGPGPSASDPDIEYRRAVNLDTVGVEVRCGGEMRGLIAPQRIEQA
jgi:hypothetical protein